MNRWNDGPCYVYALLDALDEEVYIGKSCKPKVRLAVHHRMPGNHLIRAAVASGVRFRLRILSVHPSQWEAEEEELYLISTRQPMLNIRGKNGANGPIKARRHASKG